MMAPTSSRRCTRRIPSKEETTFQIFLTSRQGCKNTTLLCDMLTRTQGRLTLLDYSLLLLIYHGVQGVKSLNLFGRTKHSHPSEPFFTRVHCLIATNCSRIHVINPADFSRPKFGFQLLAKELWLKGLLLVNQELTLWPLLVQCLDGYNISGN